LCFRSLRWFQAGLSSQEGGSVFLDIFVRDGILCFARGAHLG